jgi:hypothetical protein
METDIVAKPMPRALLNLKIEMRFSFQIVIWWLHFLIGLIPLYSSYTIKLFKDIVHS